jgi:hypothetical protein
MNRRPNGTLMPGSGGRGRMRGTRNKLAGKVYADLVAHWNEPAVPDQEYPCKGVAAIEIMFRESPSDYVKLVAGVLPREFTFEATMGELDDDAIDDLIEQLRARMLEARAATSVPLLPQRDDEAA